MPKKIDPYYSYSTNGQYIWTNHNPDVELIEPPILVSINANRLKFGHKEQRPPVTHGFTMVNHGEFPVAFKIMTTDNFIYFVDKKYGIIPGRSMRQCNHIQMPNSTTVEVSRRPYGCINREHANPYYNIPKKDRLFVLLAPAHSFSIPPATYFHSEMGYEKLRVCLEFTAEAPQESDGKIGLYKKAPGWCTWDTKTQGPLCPFIDKVDQPKRKKGETKSEKRLRVAKDKEARKLREEKTKRNDSEQNSDGDNRARGSKKTEKSKKARKSKKTSEMSRTQTGTTVADEKTQSSSKGGDKLAATAGKTDPTQKS